jgi:serine/threonine protein kinase
MHESLTIPLPQAGSEPTTEDAELAAVLDACLADLEAGRPVESDQLLAAHPAIAERLRNCLNTLNLVQVACPSLTLASASREGGDATGRLGDFELVRQVGRGGMGIVYEAKQISLARRVALKVLPFAATLDPRQLQRFWTEAQAAALLHHPHVVPVYSVGCERGVHYYAMQFIDGQSLAELIAARRAQPSESKPANLPEADTGAIPEAAICNLQSTICNPTLVALTTERSSRGSGQCRAIAQLGVQAAEALEHAHQLGVIHRDIKPANLLIERESGASGAGARLWITDFGLARLRAHVGPTLTGDMVGTLRYMSPEQALARRELVDHRTDIYSLGATLYEALTLQPAYPGENREELLRRIALDDPRPPRRLNPAIPFDLETIVLRAMAREPERRYGTAQELADDLRRFLEHRPVQAVRPGLRERLLKWAWRHQPALAAVAVVAGLAALGLVALTVLLWHEQKQTHAAWQLAVEKQKEVDAQRDHAEANFRKALAGLNRILWELETPQWNHTEGLRAARQELTRQALENLQEFINDKGVEPQVRSQASRAYESMVNVYLVQGRIQEAVQAHSRAVALLEGLQAEYPENPEYSLTLGRVQWLMGNWNISLKRPAQARDEYVKALAAYRRALAYDSDGTVYQCLAFALCDCQAVKLRNPAEALSLILQALARSPGQRDYWHTLSLAHYRADEWRAARATSEKAMSLSDGGTACDWLLLALICRREGQAGEGRFWSDRAAAWLKTRPLTDELYHLQCELEDLQKAH